MVWFRRTRKVLQRFLWLPAKLYMATFLCLLFVFFLVSKSCGGRTGSA